MRLNVSCQTIVDFAHTLAKKWVSQASDVAQENVVFTTQKKPTSKSKPKPKGNTTPVMKIELNSFKDPFKASMVRPKTRNPRMNKSVTF